MGKKRPSIPQRHDGAGYCHDSAAFCPGSGAYSDRKHIISLVKGRYDIKYDKIVADLPKHGFDIEPTAIVSELPVGLQQVEILKALYQNTTPDHGRTDSRAPRNRIPDELRQARIPRSKAVVFIAQAA
jgi:hypothetical protein